MKGYKRYKTVLFAAILAASVGCAKFETPSEDLEPSESPIVFESPIVNPATKADPFTTTRNVLYGATYPANWSFVVASVLYGSGETFASVGWGGATQYFPASEVVYEETESMKGWTNGRYWPKSGQLAFQAYSPVVNNATYNGATIGVSGVNFTNYQLSTDGSQKDLMYSNRAVNQTKSNFTVPGSTYDGVQLFFRHALSSLVFTAKTITNLGMTEIKLTEIILENVNTKGTFTQNLTSTLTDNDLTHVATWAPSTNPSDYANYTNLIPAGGVVLSETPTDLWQIATVKDLLVMPQLFGEARITITYTIRTGAGDPVPQTFSVRLADLEYTKEGDLMPTVGYNAFEMGKKYVFNIEIGLQKIRFLPYVSPWRDVHDDNEIE